MDSILTLIPLFNTTLYAWDFRFTLRLKFNVDSLFVYVLAFSKLPWEKTSYCDNQYGVSDPETSTDPDTQNTL